MRTMILSVSVLALAVMSLSALPQEPKVARDPIKYGDRMSGWIGKHFNLSGDRSFADQTNEANGHYQLVSVGVDYAEFKSKDEVLVMVPLAALRFQVSVPAK